jgi:hypothetical protein
MTATVRTSEGGARITLEMSQGKREVERDTDAGVFARMPLMIGADADTPSSSWIANAIAGMTSIMKSRNVLRCFHFSRL